MRYIIFDLDNTLYPKEIGLFTLVDQRINEYIKTRLDIDHDLVENLRLNYMDEYGTTLGGLIVHHEVDPDEYLNFVHDIDLEEILSDDLELRGLLERIAIDKVIFTNGSSNHATRVLKTLGIKDCFPRIFDIKFMDYVAKPAPRSYQKVLDALGVDGTECLLIEDLARNLLPAKRLGMTTVLIGEEKSSGIDFTIEDIFGIDRVLDKMGLSD